jgi:hypothetical protein
VEVASRYSSSRTPLLPRITSGPRHLIEATALPELSQRTADRQILCYARAISAWQLVETGLYLVYKAATKPQVPGVAASAFHAMQTTSAKLTATDAAVSFTLLEQAELLQEWVQLKIRVNTKKQRP